MPLKLNGETLFRAYVVATLIAIAALLGCPAHAADDKPLVIISGRQQTIPAADRLVDGSGTPYALGSGVVTSVGLSMPAEFSCTGSPITSSGTFTCGWVSETANKVFAAPNGAPGTPSFRLLVAADIPALSYVTSVGLTMPAEFSVAGSPVTSAGTLAVTKATQSANQVYAGPTTGIAAAPTFRALVNADMPSSGPGSGTVTSVTSANGDITVATTTTTPVLTAVSAPKWDTGRTLAITGDLAYTSPSFDGTANVTAAGTLATVNANVGSFGDATHAGQFTVNGKGLITAAASVLVVPGANTITNAMLAQAAANTMLGNWTGSTANEAANAMPSCSDTAGNHLNYVSGSGITCGTSDSHVGTVTSVAQTVPAEFAIGGSPVTSSGTLAITKATETANFVWAGPTTGAAAQPAFRALVTADCPASVLCGDTAGPGLQLNGTALQAVGGVNALSNVAASSVTFAAADCGTNVSSQNATANPMVVNLPSSPPTGCQFSFIAQTNAILLHNAGSIQVNAIAVTGDLTLPLLPVSSNTNLAQPWRIVWNSSRWSLIAGLGPQQEAIPNGAVVDPLARHGQVYFSLTGTTLQLCPINGPGGLIVAHFMREIPLCDGSTGYGLVLPAANTTASALNYIYALVLAPTISSADNTSCNGRLTVSSSANLYAHSTVAIFNLSNTTEANGTFTIASVPDATHICLNTSAFTHTGADTGLISAYGLIASATGHVTDNTSITNGVNDGVEVTSNNGSRTLVGIVYAAAGPTLNDSATTRDVLSWFNRLPKKMIVQVSGSAPNIAASTGAGTFKTLSTVIEGEFVIAGPPSLPGTSPVNSAEWRTMSLVADGGALGICALGATFNTAAQSGNAAVTGELEVAAAAIGGVTVTDQWDTVNAAGLATGLTEGREFIDIAGWNTAGNPCSLSGVLMPITLEAIIWQ